MVTAIFFQFCLVDDHIDLALQYLCHCWEGFITEQEIKVEMCRFVSCSCSRQLQCEDHQENIIFVINKDVDQLPSLHYAIIIIMAEREASLRLEFFCFTV